MVNSSQAPSGEKVKVEADLVVLATGLVPTTKGPQDYADGLTKAAGLGDEALYAAGMY